MKEQIQIFIDGKEIEYYELDDHLKNLDYITKEDGKWVICHKETKDKKIKKIGYYSLGGGLVASGKEMVDKINEIIEVINERTI